MAWALRRVTCGARGLRTWLGLAVGGGGQVHDGYYYYYDYYYYYYNYYYHHYYDYYSHGGTLMAILRTRRMIT